MIEVLPEVVTAVTAAVGTYGTSVLTRTEDAAAEATVSLGRRLIQKIFHRSGNSDSIRESVADLAAAPGDDDAVAALRLRLKKALAADPALAAEVADMVRQAGITVNSHGDGANIAQHNSGIQSSGEGATNTLHQR